jgi:hypothetical protein
MDTTPPSHGFVYGHQPNSSECDLEGIIQSRDDLLVAALAVGAQA